MPQNHRAGPRMFFHCVVSGLHLAMRTRVGHVQGKRPPLPTVLSPHPHFFFLVCDLHGLPRHATWRHQPFWISGHRPEELSNESLHHGLSLQQHEGHSTAGRALASRAADWGLILATHRVRPQNQTRN